MDPLCPLPPPSSSRFTTPLIVVGLSATTMFGAIKLRLAWKNAQKSHIHEKETRRRLEEERSMLQRSLEERKAELKKREKERSTLQRSLEEREAELEKRKQAELWDKREIEALRNTVTLAERKVEEVKGLNSGLKNRTNSLETQNRQLGAELKQVKVEHQQAVQLLDVRTAELKGAQAFLTKTDQFSGADIIKLVEELNGEIMQAAASMAENLVVEAKKVNGHEEGSESGEIKEAYGRTEEIVGFRMAELLKASEHHEDPILIQIAFQANMAAYTHWIVSSWCFESPEDEHMLSEIYARVREAEEQAISGRWRQLTRTHLQRMLSQEPDMATDMAHGFASIALTAGVKGSYDSIFERIMTNFGERIGVVMKTAQRLNKTVGEGVTSCDLEAFYIAPNVLYSADTMADALGPTTTSDRGETILCTTDLGLVRAEKVSGSIGDWHESVLLKPKVVLQSGLSSLTGEPEEPI
ncbi:hypothetical protein M413DRAFT_445619 [Hebeloma cylindrosporum]|uniref:Uncharacterized protein n=1 Tax=Hebeloma cylindrosporum TaxID=76867 RepID=A0A0C3BW21_HEBCY|nr:hypothetical protein M413DRAFT_445619 [Hebeloma cylindrosporum h7]